MRSGGRLGAGARVSGARPAFVLRRMGSARLLPVSLLVAVIASVTVTTALASFAATALPAAMHRKLARSPDTSIQFSAQVPAATAAAATRAIGSSLRSALGGVPFTLLTARWSDQFDLPGTSRAKVQQLQAAALPSVASHAELVAGQWPVRPQTGQPIAVTLPATVADRLRTPLGTVFTLRDSVTGSRGRFRVTGLYRPRDPTAPYWHLSLLGTAGTSVQGSFVTYGPALVDPGALAAGKLTTADASWLATVATARIAPARVKVTGQRLTAALASLAERQELGGLQISTGLPPALAAVASSVVVARSLLVVGSLQLVLLVIAIAALAGRLLVSHRAEETALLRARGAARGQLAVSSFAEAVLLTVSGSAAGVLAGALLVRLLISAAGLPAGRAGLSTDVAAGAWWLAALIVVLAVAVIVWPAFRPPGVTVARLRRGRQAALAGAAQAGVDVALIALAAAALWELRSYSAVPRVSGGSLGIDPVLTAAPALAIAGTALLPLRLLPFAARLLDRLCTRGTRLVSALASWQISRRPLRVGGPLLLAMLAVATGTLALAQHQSWRQSQLDRAAFTTGGDVRVSLAAPQPLGRSGAIAHEPGVRGAMPVSTFNSGFDVFAVDTANAPGTVLMRRDLSALPPAALWQKIAPPAQAGGLALPGKPARLQIAASITPPPAAAAHGARIGPFSVSLSVQDGWGAVYTVPAGTVPADGRRHNLIMSLSPTRQARYPLRVLGLSASYQLPGFPAPPYASAQAQAAANGAEASEAAQRATLAIGSLAVSAAASGPFGAPFAHGSALAHWRAAASAAQLADTQRVSGISPKVFSRRAESGAAVVGFSVGAGHDVQKPGEPPLPISGQLALTAAGPRLPVPAIASRALLASSSAHLGGVMPLPVGDATVLVRLVAQVRAFPSTGPAVPALIVDQAWLQRALASQSQPPLPVSQWWLRTAGPVPPRLPAGASVASRAATAAGLLGDPLPGVPQLGLLVIALAAAALAGTGLIVSVSATVRERRAQDALLAALGVSRAARVGQLCLEQLMLSGSGAVVGALIGVVLAHLLVPAVTLTSAATVPFPAVRVVVPIGWLVLLVLTVAAVPVLAAAAASLYHPDPAGELRAGETA